MELNDKLQRESSMLQNLIDADEEDKKSTSRDYFAQKNAGSTKDTAFEGMKTESLADVSSLILKKAKKSWFSGLMPGSEFLGVIRDIRM